MELKGTKKKKGKKIDDPDFMVCVPWLPSLCISHVFQPTLKPVVEKEVPKVVQAVRQTSNRKVLFKLLTRIKVSGQLFGSYRHYSSCLQLQITEDQAALREIMRLRGYSLMSNVLVDNANDVELVTLVSAFQGVFTVLNHRQALQCMTTWPLQNRNKVTDSQVDTPVKSCCSLDNEQIKDLATKVCHFCGGLLKG